MMSDIDVVKLKQNFTSNLAELRMSKGLTQIEVARRLERII